MNDISAIFETMERSELNSWVGGGNSAGIGRANAAVVETLCRPAQEDVFLDFGCGIGRTTLGILERFPAATIHGTDIVPALIDFCNAEIGSKFAGTHFVATEREHTHYDRYVNGAREPEKIVYDALASSIDVALAFSVFTHLYEDEALENLKFLRSTLKPGGVILATFFILDEMARKRLNKKETKFQFDCDIPEGAQQFSVDSTKTFEAFSPSLISNLYFEAGYYVEAIIYGDWRGTPPAAFAHSFQDCVVARPIVTLPDDFDEARYLALNDDVYRAGVNGASHFVSYGIREGRRYK